MSLIFKAIFSEVYKEILKPLIQFILSGTGKALWKAAKKAVASIEADPSIFGNDPDGTKKRQAALDIIRDQLKQDGKEIRTSTGNLFIELALKWCRKRWQ